MNEFVEECLEEWRRLGVPGPVATEMATDLGADIKEAEDEGGSAEDVLGNSAFDPRGFAASWALARGVTTPPTPDHGVGDRPLLLASPPHRVARRWPVVVALSGVGVLLLLGAAALLAGRRSASVAVAFPVRKVLGLASPGQLLAPGGGRPAIRVLLPAPGVVVRHVGGFDALSLIVFVVGLVGLGLTIVYWSPWVRDRLKRRTG
jgi:hypothetical protein